MEDKSVVTQSPSVNTYKSEGKLYEVPKENEQEFLDNVKDAQKVFMFESEGKKYEVPPADVSEFMTNVTDAKPLHNYDFSQNPNASIDQSSESAPQPATQSDKGFWANAGEDFVNASKLAGYHLAKATEYQAAKIGDKMGGLSDNQSWKDYWKSDSDQSKENIQSLDKWGNAIPKLHGGAGGFVASSLPMIGATAAAIMLKNPMAASALTGTMGQMMFGSGIDAYDKHIDEQKDLFSKGQIAKEPTVDEGTKLGTGILYGVLGTLPIAGTIGKWIPKGLFQKSIQTALESNPETINNAGKVIWENFVKDAPGVAKQLLNQAKEGLGSSIANMEVMQLGQKAVDKWMIGQEGIGVKEFGETAVSALGSAILFHGALVPFSMYAQNTATMQRRNSQGRVDLGKDVEGNPVEIVKDGKGGFYGVTPEGKTVKVDPDEAQNIVTIPINVFKQSLQEAKGNGGKLFENADVYAVKGNLENTANQVGYKNTGDILIHFDQDGKRFFVKDGDLKDPKAKLTLVGEDGKTYSGTVPRNQINTLTKEQFINEGLDRYTSTKPTEVTDPILPHIEAKRTEHIDQVDNHIANFQHESGNLIKVKTQKGAERYVIKGDLNDPGDMIFLKDPNNPSEPPTIVTSQGLEIIDQVPSDQYRQSQIADFDAQSADVVDKLNQKKQQKAQEEAHATSLGIGDPVTVPDGRTGKISRVNGRDQVFVALDENEGQEVNPTLYNPSEITKIEPPVEQSTIEPVTDQQNEQQPNPNPTQDVPVHKEQLINIGTASKPQNTRIVTDPDGIKRIDVNFDTDAKAKKVAEIIRTKGKVSANYDVTVDKVEINPDDEFTDVIYTVTLRPKVAVVPKIDEKSSETAGPPTVEVKQGQVPKTSAPVEPVKGENVAENVNITETKNEIVPENKIQESKIEPITDLGNLESSHKLQVLQKVNQESLPKEGAELSPEERKTVHNSLVGLVEKFNDIPNNHTNKRSSVQSQILQTVQRLGEGYKVDVDRQRNITVTKEGKKIGRIGTKQSTEEVNTHPLLSEYPQEVQDFYGRLNASNSIEFLDIPTSINQGVRNIQEGKKSVAANSVLDEVERMFSEGVVKLKGTKNSPAINVPVQEYFATFEKPLSPEEEKFAETLSQDDHEKLWQIASYYDLTPEQTEEVDNLFLEHGKESQIDRTAGVQPEVDAEGAKPEVTGRNQGEDLSQGQITQVQDELKKARAAYSKANNLYNKLKNSPEFGGKGQISQDGTIAGHDAIDFGNDAILNGAKKKADQARLAVTETEKKLAKLEDEKVDKVHNQQDLFKEESSPLTDLIESAKKKSEPIVPLNTQSNEAEKVQAEGKRKAEEEVRPLSEKELRLQGLKEKMKKLLPPSDIVSEPEAPYEGGFNSEIFSVGAEMAMLHVQMGKTSFSDFSKAMVGDFGSSIKPYLKAFYNGARDLPGMEEYESGMDEYKDVKNADIEQVLVEKPLSVLVTGGRGALIQTPKEKFVDAVVEKIRTGQKIQNGPALTALATESGLQAGEHYMSVKELYDLAGLAINKYILSKGNTFSVEGRTASDIRAGIPILENLQDLLPTETQRSAEQVALQQFSTPPALAYIANWAAQVNPKDTMLEPSAGEGNIAVFAKVSGANVIANEFDENRLELIRMLGIKAIRSDAKHIHLHPGIPEKVTVVVMNPPFSRDIALGDKMDLHAAEKHIDSALEKLEPGGRLVAIVGKGMSFDSPTHKPWWDKISKNNQVKANILISGDAYRKKGTNFDNRLLVIDKSGPAGAKPITGSVDNYAELLDGLEHLPLKFTKYENIGSGSSGQNQDLRPGRTPGQGPGSNDAPGIGLFGHQYSGQAGYGRPNPEPNLPPKQAGGNLPGENAGGNGARPILTPNAGGNNRPVAAKPSHGRNEGKTGQLPSSVDNPERGSKEGLKRLEVQFVDKKSDEQGAVGYDVYRPEIKVVGSVPHPTALVESTAMASVSFPKTNYRPLLKESVITSGALSEAQLEDIVLAGGSHSQILNSGERRGFFLGGGTGYGKGRAVAAIIQDNINQGRKKAVWISKNANAHADSADYFEAIGGNPDGIFYHKDAKTPIAKKEGVLLMTYGTLKAGFKSSRDYSREPNFWNEQHDSRLQQIAQWLGKDFDGVIIFDESHQMANAIASQGGRGMKKASQTALAGVELQKMLPNARVVYASATGATEVSNLAYAQRLGLWGDGTPFANSQSFINAVESSGLAGMEIISKDLKAMGLYSAKNLSFDGVGYETLQHNLSPEQVELYNQCADAWQLVLRNIDTAIEQTGASSGAKAAAKSAFWGAHQRFFGQIIMTMQMPTVIQDIQKSLEEGKAIVLQLVNTNEAATKRALTEAEEDAQGEEVDFEELDLSPKASLIEYIRNGFPVNQFQTVVDENGNERQELVMIDGKPVQNPNAVRLRDNLIANLERELFLPEGPLDIIINTFGVDKVAEITGRTVRIVRKENPDGNLVKVEESRTTAHVAHDKDAFMDGKKDILVFSDAGGTGASFHSDLSRINQKQRKHYVLQAGWRADKAVQGFGRSHRSNQRIAPIFSLATTDLKAHRRYLSSVAKRLDQLGALTKGSRQAGGQGILDGSYNLEGSYATQALFEFYQAVEAGRVPGVDMSTLEDQMALKIYKDDKDGNRKYNEDVIFNTKQFLNRIMSLRVDLMDKVFDGFMERLEEKISNAKIAGTYDEGIEAVHAIHTKVIDEVPIYTDEKTGGQTFLTSIELELPNEKTKWSEILSRTDRYGDKFKGFWTEERSGKIYAIVETMEVQPDGFRDHKVRRISVVTDSFIEPSEFRGKYHKLPDEQAAKAKWNEDYEAYPATRKKTDHIVKGLILPIWNRLPEKINVRRYVDDNGAPHLGRWFSKKEAEKILETFEVANTKNYKVSDAVNAIRQDGYFKLANQFEFTKGKYQGLDVIKITGPRQYSDRDRLERAGAMFQVTSTMSMSGNFYVPIDTAEKVVDNIIQLYNSPIIAIEDAEGNNFNRVNEPQTPYNKSLPPSDFLKQSKTPSSETVSTTPLEDLISKAKENKSSNSDVSLLNEKKRTYKTKEGETLQYSLFSDSDSSVNDRSGTGLLQREESRVSNPSLRQLKEGEITSVEQKYTRDKNFVFDGRNKIESTDDIAYLFRQLENKSVENMFACFVKDGKPTIVHMSAGGQSSTVFNHQVLNDGISRFSPDIVYLIHNHPSGNLQYSDADIRMHQGAIDAFGDIIGEHILINLTSGLYATFRSGQSSHEVKIMPSDKNRAPEIKNSEKKYTVYSFDKQVFKENAVLPYKITGPDQVAEFISAQRFTDGNKLSALILARNNDIKAYIHLSDVDLSDPTAIEGLIKELQAYSGRFGGQGIILSGTRGLDYEAKRNLRSVKETLKKSDITLQDYVSNVVNRSQYESLANEGLMEPSVPYEAREVNDPGKSKPTHALDYLNGTVPYSRGIKSIKEATKYIPGVTEGKEVVEKFKEALNITSSPSGKLNKESGELAKRSLRENLGTMSRNLNMAAEQLKKASNRFDRLSKDECLDFYDKMETGQKQSTEGLQGYADALRTYYDKTRDNVRDLGTGKLEQFNENYMAHFYENEGRVSEKFYAKSKTPLEGPKGFLRQRTYDTLKDAMDHGLIPISYNPVVMAMMKIREMERYVMAHKTLNELKDTKYISYYKIGTKPPEGWTMIDDKVSRVMIPKEGGLIHVGNWYALDGAADIFNRFLSKGLRGNQLYNLWRGLGNLITQFQLGFSFFHLGFTSLDASISKLGMGAGLVYHGKPLEGLKHIALSPFAPITNIIQGDRLQKAWYGNPSTPEMQEIAKFMEIAGGRAKMDDMYREKWGQKIIDNWKKNRYISALGEIPLAIVEKSNWLVLEYIVPKQKMGVFVDMARREIMLHPNDTPEERRRRLQYNWNSVDNRMGQLAYDNLFWNKTLKDIAFGTIRSVGWNLGTIREVGGAPIEAGHIILDALHGKTTKDTNKVEYVLGMIGMGMLTGAIFMYLRTGKRPETMKDYFFPQDGGVDKNGDPTRVSMPSYLKDIYHYFNDFPHGLLNTAKNKLSPLFGIIVQIATNKDYFGTKIYNEDDPIFQQGKDLLWYLFGQFKPFGISNAQKNESKKFIDKALPFIGITPAPYDLNMTDTEKLMSDILREKLPIGGRTKEQAESSQSRYKLRNAYQADHNVAPLISAMISGEITSEQLNDITKNSGDSPLKRNAKKLTEVELAYVYRQSDLKVKKQLAEILREKVIRKLRTGLTKDERENFMQLLDQIRTEQNTTEPKEGSHQSSADQLLKYLNK